MLMVGIFFFLDLILYIYLVFVCPPRHMHGYLGESTKLVPLA
jgi:hypothetical protein